MPGTAALCREPLRYAGNCRTAPGTAAPRWESLRYVVTYPTGLGQGSGHPHLA
ncbi:MAG: hypothetical protein FWD72_01265 [Eggerthellaceae bacterium]|nr:hypothetical protein [Eggerthellaceae bacterium]